MSEKIVVPEGMLKAAGKASGGVDPDGYFLYLPLQAALLWLSENPIVPTDEQVEEMRIKLVPVHPHWGNIVAEWQRRMFLASDKRADMHPLLQAWLKDADTMGVNNAMKVNFMRLFDQAFQAGREAAIPCAFPNPVAPEEIGDLLWPSVPDSNGERGKTTVEQAEFRIVAAFRRGQDSANKEGK